MYMMWAGIQPQKQKKKKVRSIFLAIAFNKSSQATELSTH